MFRPQKDVLWASLDALETFSTSWVPSLLSASTRRVVESSRLLDGQYVLVKLHQEDQKRFRSSWSEHAKTILVD